MRHIIATAALKKAKDNYADKMDEFAEQRAQDYVAIGQRLATVEQKNTLDARRDDARIACVDMASESRLATSSWKASSTPVAYTSEKGEGTLTGSASNGDHNFKETVTTTFDMETFVCHKCIRTQKCTKPRRKWCKTWAEPKEECVDIQL